MLLRLHNNITENNLPASIRVRYLVLYQKGKPILSKAISTNSYVKMRLRYRDVRRAAFV